MLAILYMKVLFLFCTFLLIPLLTVARAANIYTSEKPATELHADGVRMKTYVLALLKTGTNRSTDKAYRDSLYSGHIATIKRLVSKRKMVVVGPLTMNEYAYRSILVLDVSTLEQAKILLDDDPAIHHDMFEVELYLWEGPATLPAYLIKPL